MDWRELVLTIQPQARVFAPASEAELVDAELAIGGPLPPDLRALFLHTDGVLDAWMHGPILPLLRLVEATRFWRSVDLAAEFDSPDLSLASFVVIGTDAGGGPFGFSRGSGGEIRVQALDGEAGAFHPATYSLKAYLTYYFASLSSFSD